jgi:hypothetical protein
MQPLWTVQGCWHWRSLQGGMKVFAYEKYKATYEKKWAARLRTRRCQGRPPDGSQVAPGLSAWAAVGLEGVMLLAIGYHLRRSESPAAPAILCVGRACSAWAPSSVGLRETGFNPFLVYEIICTPEVRLKLVGCLSGDGPSRS